MGSLSPRGHRRRLAAFTLVELAVAAAVVVLALAAGAVCAAGARGADEVVGCQTNLQTIGAAAAQYSIDHRGWIVGSPGTSGRELLNDQRALGSPALEVNGDATQPFDWAGPLAWSYLAPDEPRPDRRDERFALLNGTPIPDYTNPNFDPANVDMTRTPGTLGVFADPAQSVVSLPFSDNVLPHGMPGTAFQPQLAISYTTAIEFMRWQVYAPARPRWAGAQFWANSHAFLSPNTGWQLPGLLDNGLASDTLQPQYRPFVDRVSNPSAKIFLADGTRYQSADLPGPDHEISASVAYGGAFADWGAHNQFTHAWPAGMDRSGRDMTAVSFRHGGGPTDQHGNALFFDGSVRLLSIAEARRPERWLPRGTLLDPRFISASIRDEYPVDIPGRGMFNLGAAVRIP